MGACLHKLLMGACCGMEKINQHFGKMLQVMDRSGDPGTGSGVGIPAIPTLTKDQDTQGPKGLRNGGVAEGGHLPMVLTLQPVQTSLTDRPSPAIPTAPSRGNQG